MVMTFHNRNVSVWMALHRAAYRAGFKLPERSEDRNHGMIYQDYIENFKQTFHSRAPGSLLGDFILTFKKVEEPERIDDLIYELTTGQQKRLEERIRTVIEYHGGLDNTSIGNLVVETLADMNLLHRFAGSDLSGFYKSQFVYSKKEKKWYTREMLDPANGPIKIYDVLPVERAVEHHLYSFFQEKKAAAQDELLFFIFTKLINSQRPGMEVVQNVMKRCCERIPKKGGQRDVYMWKTSVPKPAAKLENNQYDVFDASETGHNEIIGKLAEEYRRQGYSVHIGRTEVRKVKRLGEMSVELDSYQLGIPSEGYDIIKEIDLLVLKNKTIIKAVEVVTTLSTLNKAINDRFRNLLSIAPNLNFDLEIHLFNKDMDKASKELNTPANVETGLNKKVKLIPISYF